MDNSASFTWQPVNPLLPPAEDAIDGILSVSLPSAVATPNDADIPNIVVEAVARYRKLPEVVRHRQEADKASDIGRRMQECGEQLAELAKRRAEARDVAEMLAITKSMKPRQAAFDALQENAELIAATLPNLAEAAHRAVQTHSDDELAGRRCELARAAHVARERADKLLGAVAAEFEGFASSPSARAAVEAHVGARRAAAASTLLNNSTGPILAEIQAGIGVAAS